MGPKRPSQTTMEGMLWNANHVLDSALDPKNTAKDTSGKSGAIPKDLINKCHGIVLISVVEAGFIFSGSVGSGVLMAHYPKWGTWSAPSAVSLKGIGFGFFLGKGARDVVILIMDPTLKEVSSGLAELRFGVDTDQPMGRDKKVSHESVDFIRGSYSFVFSKGFFTGVSLGSSVLVNRHKENERFYGKKATPREILFDGAVTPPEGSGVSYLHEKLNFLKTGKKSALGQKEIDLKESLRAEADKAAEEAKAEQIDEIEYVEAEKEAEKEGESEHEAEVTDGMAEEEEVAKEGETAEKDGEGEKEHVKEESEGPAEEGTEDEGAVKEEAGSEAKEEGGESEKAEAGSEAKSEGVESEKAEVESVPQNKAET